MTKSHMPVGAGQLTPRSEDARGQAGIEVDQKRADRAIVRDIDSERKAFTTMQARVAMCGCTVCHLAGASNLIGRWGCSKTVPCLQTVGDMLCRMGLPS